MTDASISNEDALLTQIQNQFGDSRLFMVGIGSAPNSYFMESSAKLGKGTFTYIGDINEVKTKMSALFTQLSSPVMRDIEINYSDGSAVDYWPNPISDLYKGEALQVEFKIDDDRGAILVSGTRFENNH
ncbi:MAG TPA: hypothetical protein EYH12_06210 [Psychromonas hadalis]|nr:hypothetical protein [Psychromonas hadalis]